MAADPKLNRGVLYRDTNGVDYAATIIRLEEEEGAGIVQLAVLRPLGDSLYDGEPVHRVAEVPWYAEQKPEGAVGVPGHTWRYPRRAG
jgi:hypothetical protein